MNVSVIGAGTMGNGIAHVFAQNGYKVNLIDVSESALEKAIATITRNLDRQVSKGSITEDVKQSTLDNITSHSSLGAISHSQLVVEQSQLQMYHLLLMVKHKVLEQLELQFLQELLLKT